MENVEVSLVKPKIGLLREILGHMATDINIIDLNHQMYVPGRFVFGHFKERKDGFILSPGGIYYAHAGTKEFGQYTTDYSAGKYEQVKQFFVPDNDLVKIITQANVYQAAKKNITEMITPLEKYF